MLQQIRDKITGWFAGTFLVVIAIVFIFWGIQFESGPATSAATVNGEEIPVQGVIDAWQARRSELMQQTRDELPEELVQKEQQQIISEFVRRELLMQRTEDLGYRVSDQDMVETLASIPALQVDGAFSRDRYAALLRQQGRTEAQFEDQFRRDLEAGQLRNGIAISAFATPGEVRRRIELEAEQRDVEFLIFPAERFAGDATVEPEEIAAYFEEHKAEFVTPESVSLQYLLLELADVEAEVDVQEDALRQHYDEIAAERFVAPERRRARHILIESGDDEAAARERAEALLERARAGEDFSKLAEENSDDPGSKGQGGDLGWATRESYVPEFSEVLFALSAGEISEPVKTQFGYHIILLDAVEEVRQRTFDEVRAELEAEYRTEQAQSLFYEKRERLADETFSALNELDSTAANLGMELGTVSGFTRAGGEPFGTDRKVIDAAFSDAVLVDGQNSPVIGLDDSQVLVLRVTDHKLPEQQSLDAVREEILALLAGKAARNAAKAAAAEALQQLEEGVEFAAIAENGELGPVQSRTLERFSSDVPAELQAAVFATSFPRENGRALGLSELETGDTALFAIGDVRKGSPPEGSGAGALEALAQQLSGTVALSEFDAYVRELESKAEIEVNSRVFE